MKIKCFSSSHSEGSCSVSLPPKKTQPKSKKIFLTQELAKVSSQYCVNSSLIPLESFPVSHKLLQWRWQLMAKPPKQLTTHIRSALHIVRYEYFKVYSQHYQLIVFNRKIFVEWKVLHTFNDLRLCLSSVTLVKVSFIYLITAGELRKEMLSLMTMPVLIKPQNIVQGIIQSRCVCTLTFISSSKRSSFSAWTELSKRKYFH